MSADWSSWDDGKAGRQSLPRDGIVQLAGTVARRRKREKRRWWCGRRDPGVMREKRRSLALEGIA